MSDNKDIITSLLHELHISSSEGRLYMELLREPSTHLKLSRDTTTPRTRVYRLIENLEKRGLVSRRTDDRGTFLVAADPANLEIELVHQEEQVKQQRAAFSELVPMLARLQNSQHDTFAFRTYEGEEGLRQACWHELKTKGELLSFGAGVIEDYIPNHGWAEKYRDLSVEAGYSIRELTNSNSHPQFTKHGAYLEKHYSCRSIPSSMLPIDHNIIVYNDTVALYHYRDNRRVAIEVVSHSYADMMRAVFERYWQDAKSFPARGESLARNG